MQGGSELRVGCVGAGYFSRFHYDAWSRLDEVVAVASVDQDISSAKATGLTAYTAISDMLSEQDLDVIDIITPPPTHLDFISKALEYRPKAIICQKPFCENIDQARVASNLAERAGIPLIVHENFRFQPWYRAIKAAIDEGRVGDLLQMTFRLRPGDGQGPKAYLDRQPYFQKMRRFLVHETLVHWIDTFRFLVGDPISVFADLRRLNPTIAGEDAGFVLFSYNNGARSLLDGNRLLDHAAENTRCTMGEFLAEGTKGTLSLKGDGSVSFRRFREMEEETLLTASSHDGFGGDCVYLFQKHVVSALRTGAPFENEAHEYLRVIEIEEAIYRSSETGRWEVL